MTDHANGGRDISTDDRDDPVAPTAAVRVPVTDKRHEITMIWTVRGPWAELFGPGAEITITHKAAE